jgi:hypothetical protein
MHVRPSRGSPTESDAASGKRAKADKVGLQRDTRTTKSYREAASLARTRDALEADPVGPEDGEP